MYKIRIIVHVFFFCIHLNCRILKYTAVKLMIHVTMERPVRSIAILRGSNATVLQISWENIAHFVSAYLIFSQQNATWFAVFTS